MQTFTAPVVMQGPIVPKQYVELIDHWAEARDWFQAHSLSGLVGMAIQRGPVARHTDPQMAPNSHVVGWIIESEGHVLCVGDQRLPLYPGSMYLLDPAVEHWTEAPEGALIKFFFTSMPKQFPLIPNSLYCVMADDLDKRIKQRDATWLTGAPIVPTIPPTLIEQQGTSPSTVNRSKPRS